MSTKALPLRIASSTLYIHHHNHDRRFGLLNHHRCFLSTHPPSPPPLLAGKRHRIKLTFVSRAADSTQPSSAPASADKAIVTDDEFSLAKVCLLCG